MIEARTGNKLSTNSSEAANLYNNAMDLILGSESGGAEALDKAIALDREFALAAIARFYVARDVGETNANEYKELALKGAEGASQWEQEHIHILAGLIEQPGSTREKALEYIKENPADLLVISQLTGSMFFYDGPKKLDNVLQTFESVEQALADDWAFLARLGFAASEAGQRKRGRVLIERALAIRPQALYTIHALAHMLHDEGASEESAKILREWLEVHEGGAREGQMYGHVQWHLALAEWQLGKSADAMARYQKYCAPQTTTCGPILTLADCGGFLLRDYLESGKACALNKDVNEHIALVWGMIGHPFIALHVAGLYASAGDLDGLNRCEDALLAGTEGANRDMSLALVLSLKGLVAGEYERAAGILATMSAADRIGIGGSNVERILVDLIEEKCQALARG
ncbi:MAG: tetratricopeptide repeat protein [Gammaproteobacteria bacterium]|nr:tetratricopeptide repeat protein [Gammaproteobacteria bacterium]